MTDESNLVSGLPPLPTPPPPPPPDQSQMVPVMRDAGRAREPITMADVDLVARARERVVRELRKRIIGQDAVIDLLMTSLFAGGHGLFIGVPGLAKTLLIQTLAESVSLRFNRIQFTPDLMPSDITGTDVLEEDHATGRRFFKFIQGPVFSNLLLADEVNRTPPKTQAALLQAMQEKRVTASGTTYQLEAPFLVFATQNPIEQEGTYPLPEAQLDRFLLKVIVPWPNRDEERRIVRLHGNRTAMPKLESFGLEKLTNLDRLGAVRKTVSELQLADEVADYIVDLVRETREHPALLHGASPRAAAMLATASRALAVLRGRSFVIPDDVKELFLPAMRHRVVLAPGAEVEGLTTQGVLEQVIARVPAPR